MNLWRTTALILLAVSVGGLIAVYDTTQKLAGCMKANRLLAQAYADGDAKVEVLIDDRDGTAFVRVNEKHIHAFPNACKGKFSL